MLPAPENDWRGDATRGGVALLGALLLLSLYHSARRRQGYAAVFAVLALVVAFAFAVAVAVAGSVSGAVAIAVFTAGFTTGAFGFAITLALALAVAGADTVGGGFAVALAGAFAGAVAGVWATLIRRGAPGPLVYWVMTTVLLALSVGVVWSLADVSDTRIRTFMLFLIVLPAVNAIYDYLSFGLTRRLIRLGRKRRSAWTILYGAGDLAAAAMFFVALGLTLIAVITLMNSYVATAIVDLEETLKDIRRNPGEYWWLYISFFSTLIPTFAHFTISLFSLVWVIPLGWRENVAKMMDDKANANRRKVWAPLLLTCFATFAVVGPILIAILVGAALYDFAPDIGGVYLRLFASFAKWLGAPVEPDAVWA